MKLLAFLLLVFSFSAFADYKSEYDAIGKFWVDEYANEKNYAPAEPGKEPVLLKSFYNRLQKEPKTLKYFLVCLINSKIRNKYKGDKAFALYLESKFQGKKLTDKQMFKVVEVSGNFILNDKIEAQKEAIKNPQTGEAYFKKALAAIDKVSFK